MTVFWILLQHFVSCGKKKKKKEEIKKKKENEQAIWINAVLFYICTGFPFSLKYQYN